MLLSCEALHFVYPVEQILDNPVTTHGLVESFHMDILLRIPALDMFDPNATLVDPTLQC